MTDEAPLSEVSESEIDALVDDVLRSGRFDTASPESDAGEPPPERFHARVLSRHLQQVLERSEAAAEPGNPEDRDEWWFEVDGARLGPISIRKVRYLWEDGALTPDSLCWHEGFPSWVALFRVSELADALAPKLGAISAPALAAPRPPEIRKEQEVEWNPIVGPALESSNRERLAATQQAAPTAPPEEVAGVFELKAAPERIAEPEPPQKRRSNVLGSVVGGLVAGTVVAAALLGARVLWPDSPAQPTVVVIRDPAPAAAPAPAPTATSKPPPADAEPKRKEPERKEPKREPKQAAALERTVKKTVAPPAPTPEPPPATPPVANADEANSVDDAFAQEFAPRPDELETSEIFEVVGSHKAEVAACVQAQKAADPDTSGRLVMSWNVSLDGQVSDVSVRSKEFADLPLVGCLTKQIGTWTFPKHEVQHAPIDFPFPF